MTKRAQVRELWEMSFGDTEEFMDLFFEQVYTDENVMTIEKDGQILSSLHIIPYTLSYYGEEIATAYIAGVCTLPEMRGKGIMKKLLLQTFTELEKRGVNLSVLIPAEKWLFDYYRNFGYTEIFEFSSHTYQPSVTTKKDSELSFISSSKVDPVFLYTYFDQKLRERPICMLHSFQDFQTILQDLQLAGGDIFIAMDRKKKIKGIAFAVPQSSTLLSVKEIISENEQIKDFLLEKLTEQFRVHEITYKTPVCNTLAIPYGMGKIIRKEKLVQTYMNQKQPLSFTEQQLSGMEINKLTELLFNYPEKKAYMSLMLD